MEKEKKDKKKTEKMSKEKIVFIAISAIILILLGILIFRFSPENNNVMGMEEAKIKAENFINESLMMPGTKATIIEIEAEYGLYRIMVDVGQGELIESYISQDGELFIPSSIDIDEYENLFNEYMMNNIINMDDLDINIDDIDMEGIEIVQ
jgi:hypothetical protein